MPRIVWASLGTLLLLAACQSQRFEDMLLTHDPVARQAAFQELARFSPSQKKDLVAPLIQGLQAQDHRQVQYALDALVMIGSPSVDALIQALQDNDPFVVMSAAAGLGQIGSPAQSARPALEKTLRHFHPLVQDEAREALKRIENTASFSSS